MSGISPFSKKENAWELSSENFTALLAALDPDPETAGERYEVLRLKLLRFFRERQCGQAEDLADATLDRIAQKLVSGERIESVNHYAFGVAKLVSLEYKTRVEPRFVGAEDAPEPKASVPDAGFPNVSETEHRHRCLEKCLDRLNAKDRRLITTYYDGEKPKEERKRLAEQLGLAVGTIAVRICRLREKLLPCIRRCMSADEKNW